LNKVADKHDLKRSILFSTRVSKLVWNDTGKFWTVETDNGDSYTARFVIEGVGLLSSAYLPSFTNQDAYKGSVYHTARWPHSVLTSDLAGKRVGVIGTGSSGVQVVTELQDKVGELVVFQRSPQYVVPAQNRPIAPELIEHVRENWDEYWNSVLGSVTAFGFEESAVSSESVSALERREVFERCWNAGGGFQFMFQGESAPTSTRWFYRLTLAPSRQDSRTSEPAEWATRPRASSFVGRSKILSRIPRLSGS
jgi:cation diffusion facilitator CzcD-associated flavoprotein CzcO